MKKLTALLVGTALSLGSLTAFAAPAPEQTHKMAPEHKATPAHNHTPKAEQNKAHKPTSQKAHARQRPERKSAKHQRAQKRQAKNQHVKRTAQTKRQHMAKKPANRPAPKHDR